MSLTVGEWRELLYGDAEGVVGGSDRGPPRIIARIHPQAWVGNHAINVEPEGETEWDATADVLTLGREAALALEDDQYDSDELRVAPGAPAWIRAWRGPFWIEVAASIRSYFGPILGGGVGPASVEELLSRLREPPAEPAEAGGPS